MKKIFFAIFPIFFFTLYGCSSNDTVSDNVEDTDIIAVGESNTIRVAGSTTVTPLMSELRLAYEATDTNDRVEIQEIGTSSGIRATLEGASHIAMSSRSLSDEEIAEGLTEIPFALDSIVIIVHPDNPVENLTQEEVKGIFRGDITNWSEVGGNDEEIIVVSREDGSGIRNSFENLAGLEEDFLVNGETVTLGVISDNAIFQNSTGAIKGSVSGSRNAIGYVNGGILTEGDVRALSIDNINFSPENLRDGTYPFVINLNLATTDNTPKYALNFINFILSDQGQEVVMSAGYTSIN